MIVELNRDKRFMCVLYCNNHKLLRIVNNYTLKIFKRAGRSSEESNDLLYNLSIESGSGDEISMFLE
jgi:hypothetical protein